MTNKKRMQLHISGINMLNECGIRFQFRYIDGIKKPPSSFLIAGIGTDKAVGADLTNKIATHELLPDDVVKDIAAESVREEAKKEPIELVGDEEIAKGRDQVVSDTVDKAVRLVGLHHKEVAPQIAPTSVARKFSINMDAFLRDRAKTLYKEAELVSDPFHRKQREQQARSLNAVAKKGLDFCGEQDIVERIAPTLLNPDEVLAIRDTKTSKKSPAAGIADDSDQLTGYALASHVLDKKLPTEMYLDYLVDTKTPKTVIVKTSRTWDDVQTFLNRFANAVQALHTGIFVPTKADDWRCSAKWCGYFSICPYAKRPKSVAVAESNLVQIDSASA